MKWDFTMTQHIFLTGKKHIGKSTLIQKILDDYKKTADGFLTVLHKKLSEGSVFSSYVPSKREGAPKRI